MGIKKSTINPIVLYPSVTEVMIQSAAPGWGSWTEVMPANTVTDPFILLAMHLRPPHHPTIAYRWTMQWGIGASGSEQSIIECAGHTRGISNVGLCYEYDQPFMTQYKCPANTRIACRVEDIIVSATQYWVQIMYTEE